VAATARVRDWLDISFAPRPVVLSSPYPPAECRTRLAAVTTHRNRERYYLDPKTAGHRDPLLTGTVDEAWIAVSLFRTNPTGFKPVLQCRVEQEPGGGTVLTGTAGLGPESAAVQRTFSAGLPVTLAIVVLALVTVGCVQLAAGHLRGLLFLPAVVLPALWVAILTSNRNRLARETPMLLDQVNKVLDSSERESIRYD
jgi:hypothetical protein